MIGKPEWFARRKYLGWGCMPSTWQGWIYLAVFLIILFGIQFIPGMNETTRMVIIIILAIILFADTVDIMLRMKKDERDTLHEAIAERNALWVIVFVLAAGAAYQAAQAVVIKGNTEIDPVIIIAVVAALVTKATTNYYLDRKN